MRRCPPDIHCRVVLGGELSSHKGISVPRGTLTLPAFTTEDRTHLQVGLEMGVDLVALFVRSADDIASARLSGSPGRGRAADGQNRKPEAVDALDEILAVADAVMVARGDLGVELSPAEVPLIQKDVIAKSIQAAKPVITATQMLRSMVDSPQPTRAEAADVANAVLDSSDAVMLSEESAIGHYPVQAVQMLARIAETAEKRLLSQRQTAVAFAHANMSTSAAIGHAACLLASEAGATAIVCCTRTGRTAQLVAKYRPVSPIIAVSQHTQRYAV